MKEALEFAKMKRKIIADHEADRILRDEMGPHFTRFKRGEISKQEYISLTRESSARMVAHLKDVYDR